MHLRIQNDKQKRPPRLQFNNNQKGLKTSKPKMPLTFKHHQLRNGLDIIAEINPDSHSLAAGMFVKTGAAAESMYVAGLSHSLEHMMFRGSEKYTWEAVTRIFDEIGARYNASTSQEM